MKLNEINEIVETDFHYLSTTRRKRSPFAFPFFMMVPKIRRKKERKAHSQESAKRGKIIYIKARDKLYFATKAHHYCQKGR